jgi:hypothetical protein
VGLEAVRALEGADTCQGVMMHRFSALRLVKMLRWPVVSAGVAVGVVAASAAAASGSARPGPAMAGAQSLTWSVVPSPSRGTGNNLLDGTSCVSATACMAVGYSSASGGVFRTLAESWDGTGWSVVPSPSVGAGDNILLGVSCVSATVCTVVGLTGSGTLIESWNGSSWSVTPSPGTGIFGLYGVSCVSATACTAVGRGQSQGVSKTLIESGTATG